jgi:hypothetical protein
LLEASWELAVGVALVAALAVTSAVKRYLSAAGVAAAVVVGIGILLAGGSDG